MTKYSMLGKTWTRFSLKPWATLNDPDVVGTRLTNLERSIQDLRKVTVQQAQSISQLQGDLTREKNVISQLQRDLTREESFTSQLQNICIKSILKHETMRSTDSCVLKLFYTTTQRSKKIR
jgi:hypothetical protein